MSKIINTQEVSGITRVNLEDGFYVLAMPEDKYEGYTGFWLFREGYGLATYMFGYKVASNEEALEIIESNVDDYIPDFEDMED